MDMQAARQRYHVAMAETNEAYQSKRTLIAFSGGMYLSTLGAIFIGGLIPDLMKVAPTGITPVAIVAVLFLTLFLIPLIMGICLIVVAATTWISYHKTQNFLFMRYLNEFQEGEIQS